VPTRDELLTLQERLAFRRGYAGAFFFSAEPDIATRRQLFTSGLFTLRSMSAPTRLPSVAYDDGDGTLRFVTTLVMEQKL